MPIQTHMDPPNNNNTLINNQSPLNFQHNSQQQLVSTLQLQQQQQINNPNMPFTDPALHLSSNMNHQSYLLMRQNQRNQIDQLLKLQNERLNITVQEQMKEEMEVLLRKKEVDAVKILNEKDKVIEDGEKKNAELEAYVMKKEAENEKLRRTVEEKGAVVLGLNQSYEHIMQGRASASIFLNNINGVMIMPMEHGAESQNRGNIEEGMGENNVVVVVSNNNNADGEAADDEEEAQQQQQEQQQQQIIVPSNSNRMNMMMMMMVCKSCNIRRPCIMFLPCRHLCSCHVCEPHLHHCPICTLPKNNTIKIRDFDLIF